MRIVAGLGVVLIAVGAGEGWAQAVPSVAIAPVDAVVERGTAGTVQRFRVTRTGDTEDPSTVRYTATPSGVCPASSTDFLPSGFPSGEVSFQGDVVTGTLIARPTLSAPVTFTDKCPEDGNGPRNVLAAGADVMITLPTSRTCTGNISVNGANDLIIIGGEIVCDGGTACPNQSGMININGLTGTAHIEGVHLKGNGKVVDLIREFDSPNARLVIQNVRGEGWAGMEPGWHGDCVHAQGGGVIGSIAFQNVTCDANFNSVGRNALQLPQQSGFGGTGAHALFLNRVNIRWSGTNFGVMYNFGGNPSYPDDQLPDLGITLTDVYGIAPLTSSRVAPPVTMNTDGVGDCVRYGTFPEYTTGDNKIVGKICEGTPAGGDFAPAAKVGRSYSRALFE